MLLNAQNALLFFRVIKLLSQKNKTKTILFLPIKTKPLNEGCEKNVM